MTVRTVADRSMDRPDARGATARARCGSARVLVRVVLQDARRLPARFHARLSATFDAGALSAPLIDG